MLKRSSTVYLYLQHSNTHINNQEKKLLLWRVFTKMHKFKKKVLFVKLLANQFKKKT